MDPQDKIREIESSMELNEALKILAKEYTGSWEGIPTLVCDYNQDGSNKNRDSEIYHAWVVVKGHLKEVRRKNPPVYPMTEFRKALLEIPTETLVERLDLPCGLIERYKRGSSAPYSKMQERIIEQLAGIV